MREVICQRCSHRWYPRIKAPKFCPSCKSPYWNKERRNELENKSVALSEVKELLKAQNWAGLRALHPRIKTFGFEGIQDEDKTVSLMYEITMAGFTTSPVRLPEALNAIERGVHPYDDPAFRRKGERDAAIAARELKAITGK